MRTGERTITIVYPAFVDHLGVLHEEAIVHAVIEGPRWISAPTSDSKLSRSSAPSLREAAAEAPASVVEGLEVSPPQAPHPISASTLDGAPTSDAIAAARSGHRIGPIIQTRRPAPAKGAASPGMDGRTNASGRLPDDPKAGSDRGVGDQPPRELLERSPSPDRRR